MQKPPEHLREETKRWWRSVTRSFELEEHHIRLLTLAGGEVWDRGVQAREVLDREGLTYEDRFGQPCSRPEVAIDRDSRIVFAKLVRELDWDSTVTPLSSRPPALHSNKR